MEALTALVPEVMFVGHMQNITVSFLITQRGNDRQISIEYARWIYEEAVDRPDRELKLLTPREGGAEHVNADNMQPTRSDIADRFVAMADPS